MKRYGLGGILIVITVVLVVAGVAMGGKLNVVGMNAGSSLAKTGTANSPKEAVLNLWDNVQRRNFDGAYSYVQNTQDVDKGTFYRDLTGIDGNLKTFANVSEYTVQQLANADDKAKVRANLTWATALGAFYESHDYDVVKDKGGWKVVWQSEKQPNVPPQVIPVTYPRWDVVSTSGSDQAPAPKVKVISQNTIQMADNVVVVGEIENQDDSPAFVSVTADLIGKDGSTLGGSVRHRLPGRWCSWPT